MNLTTAKIKGISANPLSSTETVILATVLKSYAGNSRVARAHTKDRSDVRGGGKKPWRQKGTGRARAGSIRSPLWRGGGVTFGPTKERNFTTKINAKVKSKALLLALQAKFALGSIWQVDGWAEDGKTKTLATSLKDLSGKILLISAKPSESLKRASGNLPKVFLKSITNISSEDIARADQIVFDVDALATISKKLN